MTSRYSLPRESIWSVRQEDRPRFSYYFSVLFVIGTAWVAWYQIDHVVHDGLIETVMAIFLGMIQSGIAAVTITFFRFEGADAMGIALDIWREKRAREREEMIAKAVEEATAENRAVIKELKRRISELEKSNGNAS